MWACIPYIRDIIGPERDYMQDYSLGRSTLLDIMERASLYKSGFLRKLLDYNTDNDYEISVEVVCSILNHLTMHTAVRIVTEVS